MKISLSHLPDEKQDQISAITAAIIKVIQPEKIILFGSYAKGDYVEDKYIENGITYEYISDYDFLVVTKDGSVKEHIISDKIVNRFHYHTPINIIAHDIDYVNHGLAFGQYFFTDIIKEGISLYDTERFEFSEARLLTLEEEKQKAQDYFEIWFQRGQGFLNLANYCFDEGDLRLGIFQLHQATECFYNTALLVYNHYKPKTHNLHKLRNNAKSLSRELYFLFLQPPLDEYQSHLFDLLKKGYIDARYSSNYIIEKNELKELLNKVAEMSKIISQICQAKITSNT